MTSSCHPQILNPSAHFLLNYGGDLFQEKNMGSGLVFQVGGAKYFPLTISLFKFDMRGISMLDSGCDLIWNYLN